MNRTDLENHHRVLVNELIAAVGSINYHKFVESMTTVIEYKKVRNELKTAIRDNKPFDLISRFNRIERISTSELNLFRSYCNPKRDMDQIEQLIRLRHELCLGYVYGNDVLMGKFTQLLSIRDQLRMLNSQRCA